MYFIKGDAVQLFKDPKNLMFAIPKKHQLLDHLQIFSLTNNNLMMYVCLLYITIFVWLNQRIHTSVYICLEYSVIYMYNWHLLQYCHMYVLYEEIHIFLCVPRSNIHFLVLYVIYL